MSRLVKSLTDSITSITALLVLLSLSVFIAALLGIQLFRGKFPSSSRSNFDGMVASILTVFQVTILSNIITLSFLFPDINRRGLASCHVWRDFCCWWNHWLGFNCQSILCPSLYMWYLFWLLFLSASSFSFSGRYILLNVFLAIAVDNLSSPGTPIDAQKSSGVEKPKSQDESEGEEVMRTEGPNYTLCAVNLADGVLNSDFEEIYCQRDETKTPQKVATPQRSLFIFSPENKLRRACYKICNNPHFGDKLLRKKLFNSPQP